MTEYRGQKTEVSVTPKAMFFICRYLCYKKIVARCSHYDRRFTNREIRCNSEAVSVCMRSRRGRSPSKIDY